MQPSQGDQPGPVAVRCWCGDGALARWSDEYLACDRCGTLVVASPSTEPSGVTDETRSLYGLQYFEDHARALGHPTLRERARLDIPERCAFWLEVLLRFRPPPARTLELGCANGAFVGLLAEAGYDASGLDLSPAVTALARETFQVPVLTGPLEEQSIAPASLDVIILMDVLEHLPDPLATLRSAARALAPGGLLLVQTPRFDPARPLSALEASRDPFLAHLKPREHLFLFSPGSARALLAEAGLPGVTFVPAIFDGYDMSFVAAREPSPELPRERGREALRRARAGRVVEGLLDAAGERRAAGERIAALEASAAQAREAVERTATEASARAQVLQSRIDGLQAQVHGLEAEVQRLRDLAVEVERLRGVEAAHTVLLRRLGILARVFGAQRPGLGA